MSDNSLTRIHELTLPVRGTLFGFLWKVLDELVPEGNALVYTPTLVVRGGTPLRLPA